MNQMSILENFNGSFDTPAHCDSRAKTGIFKGIMMTINDFLKSTATHSYYRNFLGNYYGYRKLYTLHVTEIIIIYYMCIHELSICMTIKYTN